MVLAMSFVLFMGGVFALSMDRGNGRTIVLVFVVLALLAIAARQTIRSLKKKKEWKICRFADITGQEDLKRHLVQSVDAGRVSHAQLFTGQAGAGALALAVAYVQYLCCHHRHDGDSCGECPDCRQIAALAHPDLHLVFPVNKQGKKSGEVMRSDEFLPLFRAVFPKTAAISRRRTGTNASTLARRSKA